MHYEADSRQLELLGLSKKRAVAAPAVMSTKCEDAVAEGHAGVLEMLLVSK